MDEPLVAGSIDELLVRMAARGLRFSLRCEPERDAWQVGWIAADGVPEWHDGDTPTNALRAALGMQPIR